MAHRRSINRVILVGNVGRDPEVNHIPSLGQDVAKFSIATTEVYLDKKTNEWKEITEWHNIVAWGYAAQKVERNLKRGSMVLVEGKITTRKWKDKNDQDRWTTEIKADTVTPLDRKEREGGGYGAGAPAGGQGGQRDYGYNQQPPAGNMGGNMGGSYQPPPQTQAPPEVQIDDINDIPYDDSDPF